VLTKADMYQGVDGDEMRREQKRETQMNGRARRRKRVTAVQNMCLTSLNVKGLWTYLRSDNFG
jgi:translation initiation factor 1 (eIF-1/SUI1)